MISSWEEQIVEIRPNSIAKRCDWSPVPGSPMTHLVWKTSIEPAPARTIRCPDDRLAHRARTDRLDAAAGGSPIGGPRGAPIRRTHSGREVGPIRPQALGPADPRLAPRRTRSTPTRRSTPVRSHPRRTRPRPTAAIPRRHTSPPGLTPTHSRSIMPTRGFLRVCFSFA